ncbi:hypothetical protein IL306_012097 [Fusarium sp. DS 682]|nr:hypothetical protein IL306_012097 [Fusarium sp. DS 682]
MSRASKISDASWEQHKRIIRTLDLDEDKSPDKSPRFCKNATGFQFRKNDIKLYIEIRKEKDGKKTELLLNGKAISDKKTNKALGRYIGPWEFSAECQRIPPSNDLATLTFRAPKHESGTGPYTKTPWFKFWARAEETVFTNDAIASTRTGTRHNHESLDMVMKSMSTDNQKFTELSRLLSYLVAELPQSHNHQYHPVQENCDSLLFQWIFYASSNNLINRECMNLLIWVIDNNYLGLIKEAIALGGPTVQAALTHLFSSASEVGNGDLLYFLRGILSGPRVPGSNSDAALEVTIRKVDGLMVDRLLKCGANLNGFVSSRAPLGQALKLNDGYKIVEMLLKADADINEIALNHSPLLYARTTATAKQLLKAGAPVNLARRSHFTPIQQAAVRNDLDMAILLLNAGADPNLICDDAKDLIHVTEKNKQKALVLAAKQGHLEKVQILVKAGTDINYHPEGQAFRMLIDTRPGGRSSERSFQTGCFASQA